MDGKIWPLLEDFDARDAILTSVISARMLCEVTLQLIIKIVYVEWMEVMR